MRLRANIAGLALLLCSGHVVAAADSNAPVVAKAEETFGPPLITGKAVFRLNEAYVLWLVLDTNGNLEEVDVGAKSYYSDIPTARNASAPVPLSFAEYQEALERIGKLKQLGQLQRSHSSKTTATDLGPVNTDRFEYAFVDRIVEDDAESVRRFDVYFLHHEAGAPKQLLTGDEEPMVCLGISWYYLPPEETRNIKIGSWQELRVAGPNLRWKTACFRTTVLHDADGFTIEEPQNETIFLSDIHVQQLAGQIHIEDDPLEGVNVELKRVGSDRVVGKTTNDSGLFKFSGLPEGKYKLKVTKDGFKSLSGSVFLDHHAPLKRLSLELPPGT